MDSRTYTVPAEVTGTAGEGGAWHEPPGTQAVPSDARSVSMPGGRSLADLQGVIPPILVGVFVMVVAAWAGESHGAVAAYGVTAALVVRFLGEIGRCIPVATLMALFASIQWLFAPLLAYRGFTHHPKIRMYVDESTYLSYALPAFLCFAVGLYSLQCRTVAIHEDALRRIGRILAGRSRVVSGLVLAGAAAYLLRYYVPDWMSFVTYAAFNLVYIAALYALFAFPRHRWQTVVIASSVAAGVTLQRAMFQELVLWLAFLGAYAAIVLRPLARMKYVLVLLILLFVIVIQPVKHAFRHFVWERGYQGSRLSLFVDLAGARLKALDDEAVRESTLGLAILRANQGWIVSRVMQQVPRIVPFAGGDTISSALYASVVPRALAPDKAKAGGHANYTRFTRFTLTGTAMGISLLGEGYANFGVWGGCVFMFAVGLFISAVLRFVALWIEKEPTVILWLPLIFLQAVKAETELVVVLNYIVKMLIAVAVIRWGSRVMFQRSL